MITYNTHTHTLPEWQIWLLIPTSWKFQWREFYCTPSIKHTPCVCVCIMPMRLRNINHQLILQRRSKKTAVMSRTCSKEMFNDFFEQWNAHVHCWCNTNKIRGKKKKNNTRLCLHHQLRWRSWRRKVNMEQDKMSGVPCKDWPVGGESQLFSEEKTTVVVR